MSSPVPDTKLNVAEGPHWRDGSSLTRTQLFWLLALSPAAVASVVHFGLPALRVMCLSVAASVGLDALNNRLRPSKDFVTNWSSVSLGLMLAFLLPVTAPWWLVLVGAFLTIVIGKKLYGGWGGYPVHPVALAYAMLAVSWPGHLDRTASLAGHTWDVFAVEPLRMLKTQGAAAEALYDKLDLFMGVQVAGVGNAMVLWLLAGGLLLVLVRVVPWQIPLGCLTGTVLCAWLVQLGSPEIAGSPLLHLVAGSTVFCAFFLLGESTTSPVNGWPMLLYGVLTGVLLVLIRTYSTHPEAAVFAVLLVNLASPLLDRITPRVRGLEVTGRA